MNLTDKKANVKNKVNNIPYEILYLTAIILMLVWVCQGCRTTRVISPKIVVKDSVVYKDTTIYVDVPPVLIPGDTVKLKETVPCPDAQWKGTSTSLSNRTHITAELVHGVLTVECIADSLMRENEKLRADIKIKESYRNETITNYQEIPKWYIPWWVWLIVALAVVCLIIALKK